MRVVVADASSLILLAKCSLLRRYCERVELHAPRAALDEAAARRLWPAHPDAEEISRCAATGLIRGAAARSRRRFPLALGRGERDAIRLFLELDADVLLADDRQALRVCRLLGVPFTTTSRVIVDLRRSGAIERVEARRSLERLAIVGRYAREVIAAALTALDEPELPGGTT